MGGGLKLRGPGGHVKTVARAMILAQKNLQRMALGSRATKHFSEHLSPIVSTLMREPPLPDTEPTPRVSWCLACYF